jgi:drug/metabolite transporter (DMT)-like permease
MPSRSRVWTALVIVYVIWGSTYLAIRYAIGAGTGQRGFPPLVMGGVRFALAGGLMLAFTARRPAADGEPDPIGPRQWMACGIVGVALLLGGNGLVMLAEREVDSGIAAVVIALVPIWAALLGLTVGRERLPRIGVLGLVVGFLGAAVLANPAGADRIAPGGILLLIAATMSWASGSYYGRNAPVPRRPLVMTGMEMLTGGAALFVVGVASGELGDLDLGAVGWTAWAGAAYLVVFGSMVAFTAYVWLLRNAPLPLVTTYAYVNPAVAVLLGALFLHERLTLRALVASALILVGVALVVSSRPAHKPAEEPGPAVGAMAEVGDPA